jgi:hypothetical protein
VQTVEKGIQKFPSHRPEENCYSSNYPRPGPTCSIKLMVYKSSILHLLELEISDGFS